VEGYPKVDLNNILGYPSKHTNEQTFLVEDPSDLHWINAIWNEISAPDLTSEYDEGLKAFKIKH
jgi:hypothetical protein